MIYSPLIMESVSHPEGNEDAFLKLGEIDVYDNNLKSIITVKTEDFVKVVTDAMFKISNEYKFFYQYLKYSKVFYIPIYPSKMGINIISDNLVKIINNQVRHDNIRTALDIFTYINNSGDV